jgi:hypothetical protein
MGFRKRVAETFLFGWAAAAAAGCATKKEVVNIKVEPPSYARPTASDFTGQDDYKLFMEYLNGMNNLNPYLRQTQLYRMGVPSPEERALLDAIRRQIEQEIEIREDERFEATLESLGRVVDEWTRDMKRNIEGVGNAINDVYRTLGNVYGWYLLDLERQRRERMRR